MMHIFRIILYLFIFVSCSLFPAYGVYDSILAPKCPSASHPSLA